MELYNHTDHTSNWFFGPTLHHCTLQADLFYPPKIPGHFLKGLDDGRLSLLRRDTIELKNLKVQSSGEYKMADLL